MVSRTVVFASMALGDLLSYLSVFIFVYLFIKYTVCKSSTSIELQDVVKFYIFIEILNALIVSVYLTYSCIVYHIEDEKIYATLLLFWSASLENIITVIRSIAILTLGLDRIFIIIFPTTVEFRRKIFSFFTGISLMIISTALLLIFRIMPYVPKESFITNCLTLNCLGKIGGSSLFILLRMIFGFVNFLQGIWLLIALQKKFKIMNFTKAKNKNMVLVVLTLCITVILNFLPNLCGFIFVTVSY